MALLPSAPGGGGAPPCSTVGWGSAVCHLHSPPPVGCTPVFKKNSPRAPSLGRGKEKQLPRLRTTLDARPGPCLLSAPVLESQERGGRDSRPRYMVTLSIQKLPGCVC